MRLFFRMHRTVTRYASLGGKPSLRQTGLVQATIAKLPEGAETVAAFDADPAGRTLVGRIRDAVAGLAGTTGRSDLIFKAHLPAEEGVVRGHLGAIRIALRGEARLLRSFSRRCNPHQFPRLPS